VARKAAKKVTKRKDGKPTRAEKRKKNQEAFQEAVQEAPRGFVPKAYRGKQTTYDEALVDKVLHIISGGGTLRQACRELDLDESTFRTWQRDDRGARPDDDPPRPGLSALYARAKTMQAEAQEEHLMEIAQNAIDGVNTQSAKLQIDNIKWLMGKWHIRFADKSTTVLEGNPDKPLHTKNQNTEMTLAEAAEAYAQSIREEKEQ
jgi:hypothetical protein